MLLISLKSRTAIIAARKMQVVDVRSFSLDLDVPRTLTISARNKVKVYIRRLHSLTINNLIIIYKHLKNNLILQDNKLLTLDSFDSLKSEHLGD